MWKARYVILTSAGVFYYYSDEQELLGRIALKSYDYTSIPEKKLMDASPGFFERKCGIGRSGVRINN